MPNQTRGKGRRPPVGPRPQRVSTVGDVAGPSLSNTLSTSSATSRGKMPQKPCFAWERKGSCNRNGCPYSHDQTTFPARTTPIADTSSISATPSKNPNRTSLTSSSRPPRPPPNLLSDQVSNHDTSCQRMILGSIVTFNAGLEIASFITGFELCTVHIHGLPSNAREKEILEIFTQQGIPEPSLQLLSNKVLASGQREAKIAMASEAGQSLAVGLADLEFRDSRLSFEVKPYHVAGAMAADMQSANPNVLTVSWPSPSCQFTVTCLNPSDAPRLVMILDGHFLHGRRWKAKIDKYQGCRGGFGDTPRGRTMLENVAYPATDLEAHVQALAVPEGIPITIRTLPLNNGNATGIPPPRRIRDCIIQSGCRLEDVLAIDEDGDEALKGFTKIRVTFNARAEAERVKEHIERSPPFNSPLIRTHLPPALSFVITISQEQYDAQQMQWTDLLRTVGNTKTCFLNKLPLNGGRPIARFKVGGSDSKAVGFLKLRVERLARGERIPVWHTQFAWRSNQTTALIDRVRTTGGAFIRLDFRERCVKAFGDAQAVAAARVILEREMTDLASRERVTPVPRPAIRYILTRGMAQLRELLGEEATLHFTIRPPTLVTSGDEETQKIVARVLEDAGRLPPLGPTQHVDDEACPICFEPCSAPVRLDCRHAYCANCLRHFLTSAAGSDKFPLLCMGNEAQCNSPLSLSVIQHFLSPPQMNHLLETTFRAYVTRHVNEFKYCQTPDCDQIYRVVPADGPRASPVHCPACLAAVCPQCHEDGHEGMSCAQYRVHSNPAEQDRLLDEWITAQNGRVRRCPTCRVPIEKTEGCNHMTCQCGAHVCWRCLGAFTRDTIYEHMNAAHGGIGIDSDDDADEDADDDEDEIVPPQIQAVPPPQPRPIVRREHPLVFHPRAPPPPRRQYLPLPPPPQPRPAVRLEDPLVFHPRAPTPPPRQQHLPLPPPQGNDDPEAQRAQRAQRARAQWAARAAHPGQRPRPPPPPPAPAALHEERGGFCVIM